MAERIVQKICETLYISLPSKVCRDMCITKGTKLDVVHDTKTDSIIVTKQENKGNGKETGSRRTKKKRLSPKRCLSGNIQTTSS